MKKIVFSIVGSMLISLCVVQAQQTDTEGATSKSKSKQNKYKTEQSRQNKAGDRTQDQRWQEESDRAQGQNAYANEGMVVIDKDELPASLKQKLQSEEYAGWENGTIYHNTNTGEYVIAPKAYRFDSKGNEMEMGDASQGYSSRGRSSRYSDAQQNNQSNQYRTGEGQQDNQNNQYRTREGQQQPSSQQQADQADYANQQSDAQNRTGDQSSANDQSTQGNQQTSDQSTRDQQESQSYRSTDRSQTDAQGQPGQTSGNQYRTEDMVEVQTEQIPASLRRTLRESQYRGWEDKGTLYQDPSTNEYVLVMDKNDDSSQPRAYRFDKNGQLKEGDGSTPTHSNKQ